MSKYKETMRDALVSMTEGFSKKEIKMAIGIASDPRYKGGNYTGAFNAIEKIKKGLAKHPQVAAVLKRQNTSFDPEIAEAGHDDVKSAKNQVQIAMSALEKMNTELGKLKDEDSLPTWWTNKVAISVDKLDGMADYLDTQVEEKEEETVVESWELDEMKMDDPKLLKIFDKLKKGSTVKIKIDSSISKGKDYREFTVTAKNIVGKGKKFEQEKITLKAKDNPTGVKHFLYNRDGKVTLAIGDMGASIADIKENNMSAYTAAITKGVK